MRRATATSAVLYLGVVLACASTPAREPATQARPKQWAQPIEMPGVPNLHKVADGLYRSAQPSAEGMKNLESKLGIKTVVNLRLLHSDRDELEGTGIAYAHIPIRTWKFKQKHVLRFLKLVLDPARRPVLVHCQHGADRTGTMAAFYRMVIQDWSKQAAMEEMTEGGFHYHSIWKNLLTFIREADIPDYRAKLGLPEPKGSEGKHPEEAE